MVEGFLLGVIATASFVAALYFLKFWTSTRDSFFLAFAAAFCIEGIYRLGLLFVANPSEVSPWTYLVRLSAFALILGAILKKNFGRGS